MWQVGERGSSGGYSVFTLYSGYGYVGTCVSTKYTEDTLQEIQFAGGYAKDAQSLKDRFSTSAVGKESGYGVYTV